MEPIKKYEIVFDELAREVERQVNKMIVDGWEPLGGISISPETDGWTSCFAQAMIMRGE